MSNQYGNFYIYIYHTFNLLFKGILQNSNRLCHLERETYIVYLKQTLGQTFVFRIDGCLVNTGEINNDFLHWDFI